MNNLTWNSKATKAGTATGSSSSASASSRLTKDGTNVDEYLEAYKAKRAQKETVSENSRLTKDGTNVDSYFEEYKARRGARDTEAILSEYESLAKKYNDSIAGAQAYTSGGWKDASSGEAILKTYEELKSGVDSLNRRTSGNEGVKNTLGHGRYYELLREVESMGTSVDSALGAVKSASESYGRYDSADAYNRAMKLQGMSRETLQSEVDRLSGEMEALLSNPDYKIKSFVSAGPRSGQPLPEGVQSSRNSVAQLTLDGMQKYKELEDQRVEYQTMLNEREYADNAEKYNADPRSLGYSDLMKLLKTAEQEKASNPGRYEFVKSYYDGLSESELYDLQGLDAIARLSKTERAKLHKIYELAFALESAGMATGSRFNAEYHMKKKLVENGMDEEEAESLSNHYIRYQNALKRQASQQEYAESIQSSTGDAFRLNLLTLPANFIGGISSVLGNVSQYISNEISGKDIPLDPNAGYNKYTNFTSDVRSITQAEIEKAADFEIAGVNVAGTLYNTVMSGLDSGLAILAGGAIGGAVGGGAAAASGVSSTVAQNTAAVVSGLIMGSNAAGQEIIQSLEKGDSNTKALARGIGVGLVEMLTEKVGVDKLIDISHGKGSVIKKALQSFASEGTEEVISNWGVSLIDKLSGEGFRFESLIKQYTDQGYSRETAVQKAGADILTEDAVTFIAGGLTGAVMSAGFAVSSTAEAKQYKSMLDSEVNGSGYAAFMQGINERMGAISEISDEAEQGKAKEAVENSIRLRQAVIESAANNVRNTEVLKEYLGEEGFKAEIDHITEQKRTLDGILSEIDAGTYNVEERAAEAKELVNRYAEETAEGKLKKKATSYAENLLRQLGLKNADKTLQHNIELLETDVKNGVEGAAETLKFTREALASVKSYTDKDIANMLGGTVQGGDKVKVDAAVGVKLDHTMPQNAYAKYDVKTGEISINPYAVATAEAQMRQSGDYSESNMAKVKVVHEAGHAAAQADSSFVSQMYEVYSRLKAEGIVASYEVNEGSILDTYKKAGVIDSYLNTSSAKAQVQKLVQDGASTEDATNAVIDAYMQEEYVMNFLEYVEKSGGKLYESLAPEKRNVFVRAVQKIAEIFRGIAAKIRGTNVSSAQKMEDMAVRLTEAVQRFAADSLQDANTATESVDSSVVSNNTTEGESVETGNGTAAQNEDARWSLVDDVHTKYVRDVDAVLNGTYNSAEPLIIGRTPEVLNRIGFAELPVVITPNHVYSIAKTEAEAKAEGRYSAHTNYHGLGAQAAKNILKDISDPLMVVMAPDAKNNQKTRNSAHRVIVITETIIDGRRVISPIEIGANLKMDGQYYDANLVASYYTKGSLKKIISEVIAQENIGNTAIYYGNKKRISDFVKDLGLQLPAIFNDIQDSDVIIRDIGENVNKGIENVTQSQQFKRWFGDWQNDPENASKVVNADGTPKVMYHGTSAEFNVFDASKNKNIVLGNGHYFGENVDAVKSNYAVGKDGKVIEAYLSIKNPFVVRDSQFSSIDDMPRIVGTVLNEENVSVEDIQNILKRHGHDGIQYVSSKAGNDIWVAFDSEQIKSATDNIGTFDGSNPDIRYSLVGETNDGIEVYETSEEVRALPFSERKKLFTEIMREQYAGRTAKFTRNGHVYYARFDESDISKNVYGDKRSSFRGYRAKINVGADGNIFELVENATYNGSRAEVGKDSAAHENVQYWDYFVKTVRIDGRYYDITANVRKTDAEEFVYSIQLNESKIKRASPPIGFHEKSVRSGEQRSTDSIAQGEEAVNTSDEYSKLSLSSGADEKRIARLKEDNTFLRAQMKAGRKTALSPAVLDNLLREMRSAWGVSVEDNQAMKDMFRIVDNVSNSGKGMSDAVMEHLRGMAEKLLSNVYVTDDQNMRENEAFIKHIKSMTLSVPADNESDLSGGYGAYRRQNMKYVKLARNGTPVDTVYDELCNAFPGLLDRSVANPADQIDEIVAVMKSLQPVDVPAYSGMLSDASISFVNDIMAKYERGARETYSAMRDKKQQKAVDRASTAYEARIRQIEYRAAKDAEEYEAIIDRYQQKEWDGKMAQSRRDYSKSVLTNARAIRAAAVSPNQKKFIPEAYRESAKNIAQWLSDVSLFNGSITMDIANRVTADFARLSELYGEDFGSISTMLLDEVNSFANSQSEDHALKATYVMRAAAKLSHLLRRSIVNHNRIVLDGKKKSAADTGDALVRDLNTRKFAEKEFNTLEASGALERAAGNVRRGLKAISLNTMDGYSFLHRMGKVGDMLYDTLRAAQSKQVLYVKEYVDLLNDQLVYNKKTNADGVDLSVYTGNKPKMVEVTMANGAKMRMTAVQAMNIVSAYERAAGKEHIENGGVRLWDGEKKAYSRAFSLTATDVAALRSALDTDDLRVMDVMNRFIREDCTKWGNEATLERYGFHRFTTKDYFPLKVDRNAIPADMVKGYSVPYNVSNVGFAKATTEGASAPLLIDSFIDVVNRHVEGMATYAAYLSAEDTVNRIMSAPGVRDAMQRSLGSGSVKYMEDLMTALKGGGQSSSFTDSITDWWTKQAGHYKSAAVSYNASTAAKQPLSYIRALAVIDQKYLLKGLHGDGKSAHEQMLQYSGIGVKKDMGYSEVGVAKSIGNQIGYEKKGLGKVIRDFNEFGMKGASFMDKVTWDALWIACREEVLEMNPGISTDHTVWMEKTAKRFSEVVARTQVVDSPLDSAFKISRSNNPLVRNLFAFTNEPMKGFNLIMNSVNDLINTEKGSAAQKRARGALGKVLGVSVASWAMEALVSSIFRAVRDDDDDPGVVLEEFWPNMKSNMFGAIPYVAQLSDIISDAYNGYDFTDIGISNLVDIVESAKSLSSTLDNPESKQEKVFKQVRDLIEAVGTFAGIPIRNIDRTLVNATKAYFHLTDNYVGEYNLQKMFYNPNSNTAREKHEFNSLLADAYLSGDREAYEAIANDMRAHGVSTQAIIAGIAKDSFADDLANSDSSSLVKFKAGSEPWYIGMKAIFGRELGAPDGTEKEITRVYTLTGDTNILPKFKDGTYSVNKEARQIDGAAYDAYLTEYGTTLYEVVNAMRNMEAYRRASSAEQAWWITKAENYAAAVSIYHQDKEYNVTSRGKWIGECAESRAVDVARYIVENLSR